MFGYDQYGVFLGCSADLVLHGWEGSTAETYAQAADITFHSWAGSGTCGDSVTWSYNLDTGRLTISGTGNMVNYSTFEAPWVYYGDTIIAADISSGVTSIGSYAFVKCTGLIGITVPDSVSSIGRYAFCECYRLTGIAARAVVIPRNVTSIAADAFANSQVTTIYGYADSAAEAFCASHAGFTFVKIDDNWMASH